MQSVAMTTASTTADAAYLDAADALASEHASGDGREGVLDVPLAFVWPLAGPFGALLLSAMAWLSIT